MAATTSWKGWRGKFLNGLNRSKGNIRQACHHAKISRQSVYKRRGYDAAFDEAIRSIVESYIDPQAPHRGPLGVREARGELV